MTRNRWYGLYSLAHILVLALLLSACSQESAPVVDEVAQVQVVEPTAEIIEPTAIPVEPTNPPEAIIEPTEEAIIIAPTEPPTQAPAVVNVTTGQTDDGTFFIGDINAPVRLIDYSDFV